MCSEIIELAAPVAHCWLLHSEVGSLFNIEQSALAKVLYCQRFVVLDSTVADIEKWKVLSDEELRGACDKFNGKFKTGTGVDAILELLRGLNVKSALEKRSTNLSDKQLQILTALAACGSPEWLILDSIPVIKKVDSAISSVLEQIANRNKRLLKLMELNAPPVILRKEKLGLQEYVDKLFEFALQGEIARRAHPNINFDAFENLVIGLKPVKVEAFLKQN